MADLFEKYIEMSIKCGISEPQREAWAQNKILEFDDRAERVARREIEKNKLELEKDKLRLEEERLKREHELKLAELTANSGDIRPQDGRSSNLNRLKLKIFKENVDDMDTYIQTFEMTASSLRIDKSEWVQLLQRHLEGRAANVLMYINSDSRPDYDEFKKLLLNTFQCNSEGFRKRFRNCKPEKDETFNTFCNRLKHLFNRWVGLENIVVKTPIEALPKLIDLMIKDQIYASCNHDLVVHLKENNPDSIDSLIKLAENYVTAHPSKPIFRSKEDPYYGAMGFEVDRGRPRLRQRGGDRSLSAPVNFDRPVLKCFNCKLQGHTKKQCTTRYCSTCDSASHNVNYCRRNTAGNSGNNNYNLLKCSFCSKSGHTVDKCFKKKNVAKSDANR